MDIRVLVQVLYYISKTLNRKIDKLTAIKLIFFADRYHLRKYFKLITEDEYYAMELGPVASNVKALISKEDYSELSLKEKEYFDSYLELIGDYEYQALPDVKTLEMLSETEIEALDFSLKNFGKLKSRELVDLTHKFPEWKRFEHSIQLGFKREKIIMDDFFQDSELTPDPYDIISKDIVQLSKEIFKEEHSGITC